jgi:hypothetical protein
MRRQLVLAVFVFSCHGAIAPNADRLDAGEQPFVDAGETSGDGGWLDGGGHDSDAADTDASSMTLDSGLEPDAGTGRDGGTAEDTDGGIDAGATLDAGEEPGDAGPLAGDAGPSVPCSYDAGTGYGCNHIFYCNTSCKTVNGCTGGAQADDCLVCCQDLCTAGATPTAQQLLSQMNTCFEQACPGGPGQPCADTNSNTCSQCLSTASGHACSSQLSACVSN